MHIEPLVISAPFGNYIQPQGATPTLGTFTLNRRPGRLWAALTRIWAYPGLGGYVNKIGLRNPGITALDNLSVKNKIVSVHGFDNLDWECLLVAIRRYVCDKVELNFSCPNVQDKEINYYKVITDAKNHGILEGRLIIKLPPVDWEAMVNAALSADVFFFHCCNTLPTPQGGMSGRPLKRFSLRVIEALRKRLGPDCRIIGGGGIFTKEDMKDYYRAGSDHVSIASALLNPWNAFRVNQFALWAAEAADYRPGGFHKPEVPLTCS